MKGDTLVTKIYEMGFIPTPDGIRELQKQKDPLKILEELKSRGISFVTADSVRSAVRERPTIAVLYSYEAEVGSVERYIEKGLRERLTYLREIITSRPSFSYKDLDKLERDGRGMGVGLVYHQENGRVYLEDENGIHVFSYPEPLPLDAVVGVEVKGKKIERVFYPEPPRSYSGRDVRILFFSSPLLTSEDLSVYDMEVDAVVVVGEVGSYDPLSLFDNVVVVNPKGEYYPKRDREAPSWVTSLSSPSLISIKGVNVLLFDGESSSFPLALRLRLVAWDITRTPFAVPFDPFLIKKRVDIVLHGAHSSGVYGNTLYVGKPGTVFLVERNSFREIGRTGRYGENTSP